MQFCDISIHDIQSNRQLEQLERLFSEISPTAPWLPILVIHIRSKQEKVKDTDFKKIAKNSNFEILQETLHATHLMKLLDEMYKYDMDSTRHVGATERTRGEWNQYTPQQLCCVGGIITFRSSGVTDPE